MQIEQFMVLAFAAMMVLVATRINLAQVVELLEGLRPGGGSPPNHPLQSDDSHIVLRRRKKSI